MNHKISFFKSVLDKQPETKNFSQIIDEIKGEKYSQVISEIRQTNEKQERDALKKILPCVTVSGEFQNGHSIKNLVKHSGLLQVDIDNLTDPEKTKELLSNDKYTYVCFISPSGNGVKVIVKIDKEQHLDCFNYIKQHYLICYKIRIDESCKDVSRLMYLSHDKFIYINEKSMSLNKTLNQVGNAVMILEQQKIDVTDSYQNYLNIGFALADEFNEEGRDFYHRISKINNKYDFNECNSQFDKCLKSDKEGIKIGTLFHIIKSFDKTIFEKNKTIEKNDINTPKKKSSNMEIIKNYISTKYDLRLNIVSNEMEYKFKEESIYNPFNESNLYVELLSNNYNTSQANLTALLRSDFVLSFDPIKDYFKELPAWDQKTDYIKQLCDFIKINDHTRFDNHFKKALVRCIACTLDGYINKHAFILIGGQSSGKTYLTRWLCPDPLKDYIAENINTDKDSLIALSENFFIIMDELASLAKKEINSLKSIFTKDKVKVRRPFDRRVTTTVRRANFFGSTNNEEFLSDETGSVRWLCFKIDSIDFNYSNVIDKNGLWTQAYHLYKNGYKYELTREELLENEIINSNHQNSTQEIELIQKHYEPSNEATGGKFVTPTDIMNQLGTKYGNNIRISNVGLGKALTFLKFERVTRKQNNGKFSIKGYFVFENFE
jgi:hypothetical protein